MLVDNRAIKNRIIAFFALFFIPVLGFFISTLSLDRRNNNNYNYIIISAFFFVVFCSVPAFSDLFRHYQEYEFISESASITDILVGHFDIILPLSLYFIKILGIPFYFIPALYVSISIYLVLKTTQFIISVSKCSITNNAFIAIHIISILLAPFFVIALGLRFGLACFIALYSCSLFSLGGMKNSLFIMLAALSILTHFFAVAIIAPAVLNRFFVINKRTAVIIAIIVFIFSGFLLKTIVSNITFLNFNSYADVYLSGVFGDLENKNVNGLVNYYLQFTPVFLFLYKYLKLKANERSGIASLSGWALITLAASSAAPIAVGRYALPVTYFLFFSYIYHSSFSIRLRDIYLTIALTYVSLFSFFENGYIQRRPIILGTMWQALYEPPLIRVSIMNDIFYDNIKYINPENGEWFGHETDGA